MQINTQSMRGYHTDGELFILTDADAHRLRSRLIMTMLRSSGSRSERSVISVLGSPADVSSGSSCVSML